MDGMFEFRDTYGNIMAMCHVYGEFRALCDYYIRQGLTVHFDDNGIAYVTN